jgi:glycosyltransferase involved in cell wall biosynthesis
MKQIIKEIPDAKLVILGIGEMDQVLGRMVHDLHLEESVLLHFRLVPEEERLLYYAASDVCVFPSRYEPFGIVCTEAMSMGKPVVVGARGTSGFREQVIPAGDRISGYHINPSDPQDIAEYVLDILTHPDLAVMMGKNGRIRVTEQFTWEIAAEKTLAVYRELVDR